MSLNDIAAVHGKPKVAIVCTSGMHGWEDAEDRRRCCNGYIRVQDTSRAGLVEIGAEHIVYRGGMWRGWRLEQ